MKRSTPKTILVALMIANGCGAAPDDGVAEDTDSGEHSFFIFAQ